mgnify:CR=1 FL=1
MQALIVEFLILPAHVEAFAEAIAENAHISRTTEAGCRQFDVCRDPAQPERFHLYELYQDEAAVQSHLQSAHFLAFGEATSKWVEQKTVRRYLRTSP